MVGTGIAGGTDRLLFGRAEFDADVDDAAYFVTADGTQFAGAGPRSTLSAGGWYRYAGGRGTTAHRYSDATPDLSATANKDAARPLLYGADPDTGNQLRSAPSYRGECAYPHCDCSAPYLCDGHQRHRERHPQGVAEQLYVGRRTVNEGVTCWQREPDALRFGWTDSGELELIGYGYWDGSNGVECGSDW